jgi:putative transposase
MNLVKQIIVNKQHPHFKECDDICFKSKNLYNQALFRINSQYASQKNHLNYHTLYKILGEENQIDYRSLPQNVSAQTLMVLERNWKSYFESLKSYKKNQSSFNGLPKPPKFLHKTNGRFITTYTQRVIPKKKFKNGHFELTGTNLKFKTDLKYEDVQQVQIIPRDDHYIISINYRVESEPSVISDNYCGLDAGLNNLVTLGFNNKNTSPVILRGGSVKAINQYYNKKRSKIQSRLAIQNRKSSKRLRRLAKKRNNKIKDALHKASRKVVDYCSSNNVSTVVIGHNKNWKSEINIGKKNNQNFVSVPHTKLIEYIGYKCELKGINVLTREESYTSKCSFMDMESIRKHEKYKGKRIKRGLFESENGFKYNADLNGALNILRKEFPNCFANGIEGLLVSPKVLTLN